MAEGEEAGSSWLPFLPPRHRFTSNPKRGLVRTRKVNFACFLVGSKKSPERGEASNGDVVTLISLEGGNV